MTQVIYQQYICLSNNQKQNGYGEDKFAVGHLFNVAHLILDRSFNCQARGLANPDVAIAQMND